jgi:hypothetical protein
VEKGKISVFSFGRGIVVGCDVRWVEKGRIMFNRGAAKTFGVVVDGSVCSGWRQIQKRSTE